MRTLITIPFSHFSEKARWALDHAKLSYEEKAYLPVAHRLATKMHGGRTVPVLVTPHGALRDSTDILGFIDRIVPDAGLFPKDEALRREVLDLEELLDTKIGNRVITYGYSRAYDDFPSLVAMLAGKMTKPERIGVALTFRVIRPAMKKMMKLSPERADRSIATIREAIAEVNERLADGRKYLVGDTFTAADLTLAALMSPLLQPREHPVYAGDPSVQPIEIQRELGPLRETSAGRHALRMYREHRGTTNPRWS